MHRSTLFGIVFAILAGTATVASAQDALQIVIDPGGISTPPSGQILADSSEGLQGYVLAVEITSANPSEGSVDVIPGSLDVTSNIAALSPDLVVAQILSAPVGFTLGVVLETTPPFDNTVVPAGMSIPLAEFDLSIGSNPSAGSVPVTFSLADGVLGSPALDNVLVQGGMSISAGQGSLALGADAVLEVLPLPPGELAIISASESSEELIEVPVTLSTDAPVQGFALAIVHGAGVTLQELRRGSSTQAGSGNAEFFQPQIFPNGGTVGVVLDFQAPFDNQTLTGQDLEIARFVYECDAVVFDPDPALVTSIEFVDGVLGIPALDNVLVINNQSITPDISNGTITCEPVAPGLETTFLLGGKTGSPDLLASELPALTAVEGGQVEVGLYYSREFPLDPTSPDAENSNIQGFQFVLCFPEELEFQGFTVADSILDAIGAEFVNSELDPVARPVEVQCETQQLPLGAGETPNTLSTLGRDLSIGILLDALPPFDGQTAPATPIPGQVLLAGCLTLAVASEGVLPTDPVSGIELCEASLKLGFCLEPSTIDDDDQAAPFIENLIVVDFGSQNSILTVPTEILVQNVAMFRRGDCTQDNSINIADAALILGLQFSNSPAAQTSCEDACDVNDDGVINLADSVSLLFYLFREGSAPAAPFFLTEVVGGVSTFVVDANDNFVPGEGPDPTEDALGCETNFDCVDLP